MRYALNSAVITAPGSYIYELLTPEDARAWWLAGPVEARIGYAETCAAMGRVLGIEAPAVDRRIIAMAPDARRLAVARKGREGLNRLIGESEIGLLSRVA